MMDGFAAVSLILDPALNNRGIAACLMPARDGAVEGPAHDRSGHRLNQQVRYLQEVLLLI
jgi:hypothetical protein